MAAAGTCTVRACSLPQAPPTVVLADTCYIKNYMMSPQHTFAPAEQSRQFRGPPALNGDDCAERAHVSITRHRAPAVPAFSVSEHLLWRRHGLHQALNHALQLIRIQTARVLHASSPLSTPCIAATLPSHTQCPDTELDTERNEFPSQTMSGTLQKQKRMQGVSWRLEEKVMERGHAPCHVSQA